MDFCLLVVVKTCDRWLLMQLCLRLRCSFVCGFALVVCVCVCHLRLWFVAFAACVLRCVRCASRFVFYDLCCVVRSAFGALRFAFSDVRVVFGVLRFVV